MSPGKGKGGQVIDEAPPPEPPPAPPEPINPPPGSGEADELEGNETEVDEAEQAPAGFDVEAFVKALPDGVCLCPQCLGAGAVVEEPPFDPYSHMCLTCLGWGKVRTGSTVGGQGDRECRDCKGQGWIPNDPGELPATPATREALSVEQPRDYAGRAPDDPEFDWARVVPKIALPPTVEPVREPEPVG